MSSTKDVTLKRSAPEEGDAKAAAPPAKKARKKKAKVFDLEKETNKVIRAVNGQISSRLKWKSSYKAMCRSGSVKGCRVEVPCAHEAVFEEIFGSDTIKRKGDKLSCSLKDQDDVWDLPFKEKSYRYNSAEIRAPISASLNECKLTFSFKFAIV